MRVSWCGVALLTSSAAKPVPMTIERVTPWSNMYFKSGVVLFDCIEVSFQFSHIVRKDLHGDCKRYVKTTGLSYQSENAREALPISALQTISSIPG